MLDLMSSAAPSSTETAQSLPVEHLFTLHLELTKQVVMPGGPEGASVHVGIIDGTFRGAELQGRVAPLVGHARAMLRGEGYARMDYTLVLVTDDHATIIVEGLGITHLADQRQPRVAFTFHTASERLRWLNHVQGVATGIGGREEVTFEVYRML